MDYPEAVDKNIVVVEVTQTKKEDPSVWIAKCKDGRMLIAHFANGNLNLNISWTATDKVKYAKRGQWLFDKAVGPSAGSSITYECLVKHTRHLVQWPKKCKA